MTTTRQVALAYAESESPLVLKFKTRGLGRGCSIRHLSMFPAEKEFLYPPLTFLSLEVGETEFGIERIDGVITYTVEAQMP